MSAVAATGGGNSSAAIKKFVGLAFRHIVDAIVTILFVLFCWKVAGINARVMQNGLDWTVGVVTEGFINVLVPLVHLHFGGVVAAVVDNVFEWATLNFIFNTGLFSFMAFIGYAMYKMSKFGLGMLLIGLAGLGWTMASWGLQLLGPLVVPLPVAVALIATIVIGGYRLSKTLWGWGEKKSV